MFIYDKENPKRLKIINILFVFSVFILGIVVGIVIDWIIIWGTA